MKRNVFKTVLFVCSFICLMAVFVSSASAKDVTSGDFVFSVSGTAATVKEYKGTAKDVTIPSKVGTATVTAIGDEAFWSVKTMTSITIPSTVTSVGKAAFNECTGLTKVVLPSKVTKIGESAFWYCTNLKQILIPKSVTSIGKNAFKGCDSLTAYVIKGSYGESHVKTLTNVKMVYRYITSLKVVKSAATLQVGATGTLYYSVSPTNVYNKKASFTSSNTKVATVDANGKVTALKPGVSVITCKAKDGSGLSATCTVTVVPQKVTVIKQADVTAKTYTLKWAKSAGATKYQTYLYDEATGKYKAFKAATGTSINVKNCPVGSTQKFKVLAYTTIDGKNYKAPASDEFIARPLYPEKVTGITAEPSTNHIILNWKKSANATAYRIYHLPNNKYTYIKETSDTTIRINGVKPNTTYTFMIRAYMKYGSETANAEYSELLTVTTRPDYVSGFAVKENSVYFSKLTLQWNELPGVSGYRLSKYEEDSKSYVPFATINSADVTEFTVEDLTPGTTYSFKIQSFVKGDSILYGYENETPVTVTTNSRPANDEEAFGNFIESYNKSKNSTGDFAVISNTMIEDFSGENSEEYSWVLSAVGQDEMNVLYITDGIDSASKKPVTSLIAPKDAFSTLSCSEVSSISFDDDGNGYRIDFTLGEDTDGSVNALITDIIDWEEIASQNEGFTLTSCTYEGTRINAKVQNGAIDDITVTVPVTVKFTIGENSYEFSETIVREYLFIW